jgi:hypothetical protein
MRVDDGLSDPEAFEKVRGCTIGIPKADERCSTSLMALRQRQRNDGICRVTPNQDLEVRHAGLEESYGKFRPGQIVAPMGIGRVLVSRNLCQLEGSVCGASRSVVLAAIPRDAREL